MPSLLSTSDLVKKYQLNAKKSLGQNFIFDQNFTDKIVKNCGEIENKIILEIGAGPGTLTRSILAKNPKKLIVVEKDKRAIELLKELQSFYGSSLEIIEADATKIDETAIVNNEKFKIIANLPYNIGTLLLIKWLKNLDNIESMHLMLQREVAQRIEAEVNQKHYGRLSVISNLLCKTKIIFEVSPTIFTPPPKVVSAIIELIPRNIKLENFNLDIFEKIVASAFNQRRKMLRSSLKSIFNKDVDSVLRELNIDSSLRAENITIEQFIIISQYLQH